MPHLEPASGEVCVASLRRYAGSIRLEVSQQATDVASRAIAFCVSAMSGSARSAPGGNQQIYRHNAVHAFLIWKGRLKGYV
jgi:hypothetical protein